MCCCYVVIDDRGMLFATNIDAVEVAKKALPIIIHVIVSFRNCHQPVY
jgi:hypothetical protein